MTVHTNITWNKIIAAAAVPVIGFAFTAAYFTGQMTESFGSVKKDVGDIKTNLSTIKANVDTLKDQRKQDRFDNALQFQALWAEIRSRNSGNKINRSGVLVEKYVNGKLTYASSAK